MTRDDKGNTIVTVDNLWVKKADPNHPLFDPIQERDTFLEARRDFTDFGASTSQNQQGNGQIVDSERNEGTLRNFLESFIKLIRDQTALVELQSLLGNCEKQGRGKTQDHVVNQVR